MSALFTFTSANTVVLVNDKALSGLFKIDIYDESDKGICNIMLRRHVIGDDDLINEMRVGGDFSFKLLNNTSSAGYVSDAAKIKSFHMVLSKEDDGKELLLEQTLVVTTSSFLYSSDARSAGMKATEEEDLKNLINIIKENKAKANVNRAVLPSEEVTVSDDELVWLNAKDPEQLKDVKPRKLKKTKRA